MEKSILSEFTSWLPIIVLIAVWAIIVRKKRRETDVLPRSPEAQEATSVSFFKNPIFVKGYNALVLVIVVSIIYSKHMQTEDHKTINISNQTKLDISMITQENIKKIIIRPGSAYSKEKPKCLTKPYQEEFVNIIRKMSVALKGHGRPPVWNRIVDIDAGETGKYQLEIKSRGSYIHADFHIRDDRDQRLVVIYDAEELSSWLNNLPAKALQDFPPDTSGSDQNK